MAHDIVFGERLKAFRDRQANITAIAADRLAQVLMPDSCVVRPAAGTDISVNAKGISTMTTPANKSYRGSELIPCRADVARAFRPDKYMAEVAVVDELDMHFPLDFDIQATDLVYFDSQWYKIRKLDESSAMDISKVAKIFRLGEAMDNPMTVGAISSAYSSGFSDGFA